MVDTYLNMLHLKRYSPAPEKTYLSHLSLFLNYINNSKDSNADSKSLLNHFNIILES